MTRRKTRRQKQPRQSRWKFSNAEVRWLASTRATTVTGLKLKASYACIESKLADSILEDILQL